MKLLSFVPLIAASTSTNVYDSKTIVSVTSADAFVDVRDVPKRLEDAKVALKPEMAAFLKTATIKTLKSSGLQVVATSEDTVSSDDLCAYLKDAASKLSGLDCECSPNFATKEEDTSNDLGVNDPNASSQRAFKRMNMQDVWRLSAPYARRTVAVAVMDSGLNFSDPEIAPYRGVFRKKSGGFIDGGWNFVNDSSNLTSVDQHGQACARIIAARKDNNKDMAGMSSNVRLLSLKTQREDGFGSWVHMAEAMDMAVDIGVDVVSISLGEFIPKSYGDMVLAKAFKAAIDQNIIVVASSGNDGLRADTHYPCPLPGVICVGALMDQDTLEMADFSNYGNYVDIAAYGTSIYVGNNERWSGTSFACPIVSGAAAILLSMGVKPKYVAGILTHNVDRFNSPSRPMRKHAGALNPLKAVNMAIDYPILRR
ncbi:Thermitase, putative [Perkinsus marinus ATCC 50983]|uniref:subtilisin n=1 Tax=Perkinsus marinus (strain ATCC 50983 / TXsc) TaxID=423536 RepID=C5KIL3_PERM5|nr:Thermitase, putative [Perkinsus marinus ATCC 50983]EER15680.1 Thermitase, putative [Perkinsus marinus ATCC 50983]|eukprot:XP_002783884.1 Thermitase, putative [Perkinsus marinus ATCC 50983]